ncbi:Adenylate cyclase [Minicystis rosea]|nr:Adenylate cyclase [Minicystis rosea]
MKPGTLIDERYVIVARVGAGGMGTIFRADDRREGRPVALKILRGNDSTDIERFVREAAILAELDHPNIVRYVGHGLTTDGEHYLAMEWLDGEDLAARIARTRLSDAETLAVMRQAVAALACAHERGAVHRDIKPSNLFLRDNSVEHLAMVDFGVAGLAGDARRLTQTGMLLGTPGYMAPEQVEGSPVHDPRSDVFSLGCVLFECLTGRPAFEGANPMAVLAKLLIQESPRLSELRPEIPELDALVGRMLAKNPMDRPQTILEVAAEIDRLPPSVVTRTPRPKLSDLATTLHSADSTRERQAALGRSEQRLVTVVLAGDAKISVRSRPQQVRSPVALAAVVEPYGGHLTPLAGGAMIVTTWTPGTALDRAERAALCALALREQFPEIPITIATGRGLVAARVVEGDVIDRAARLLATTKPGVVSLDEATAGMLPARFRVERDRTTDVPIAAGSLPPPAPLPAPPPAGASRFPPAMFEATTSPAAESTERVPSWTAPSSARSGSPSSSARGGSPSSSARGYGPDSVASTKPGGAGSTLSGRKRPSDPPKSGGARTTLGSRANAPPPSSFALRGAAPAPDGIPLLLGKPTQCHGRARELSMLEGIYSGCIAEPVASAALVTGAAGAGKSRLRRELVDRVRKRGEPVEVLSGRADSMASGSPFGVVADVIRNAAGIREGEPLEVRRKKLSTRLARTVPEAKLPHIVSFLGELISTPFPDAGNAVLVAARDNAMLMGDAMRAAWEEWLMAECAAHPVLLVLEDLQWGDGATARLVDSTLRNLRDLPLMVLMLARPEAQNDLLGTWTKSDVPVIRLGPLPTRAAERLVREALGADVDAEVVRGIIERAAGNPFYLEELIRAVAAGRGDVLPDSVLGTVEARLDAEGTEAKRTLRAASVFGDRFWVGGVAALLGGNRYLDEARRMLVALSARELVAPSTAAENEYVFCHTLVREAAYAMLTEADRALGHQLAGDWLERTDHTDAMAMAEHFRRGGEPGRAVRWYRRAAEQALEANDLPAVLDRCAQGVDSGAVAAELGAMQLLQAEAHVWRGELEDAEALGQEAIELLEEGSTAWFRAVRQVINAASKLGGLDRVERLFAHASAVTPARGARRAQIIALADCPSYFIFGGHYAVAMRFTAIIDQLVAEDPSAIDAEVKAQLHQMRAIQASAEGDLGATREGFVAALAAFEAAGDQRNASTTRSNLGSTVAELGDFEGAEAAHRAAFASAERMGLYDSAARALSNLGHALAHRGNAAEARLVEQRAVETFHRQGDQRWEGVARTYLAKIALFSGDLAAAERDAREAAELLQVAPPLRPAARAVEARALLGLGRADEALCAAREAFATLIDLGALEEGEALVRLVHAEALAATGATDAFREAIGAARDQLLLRASKIRDPVWRDRFLHGVPENARTLELSAQADLRAS